MALDKVLPVLFCIVCIWWLDVLAEPPPPPPPKPGNNIAGPLPHVLVPDKKMKSGGGRRSRSRDLEPVIDFHRFKPKKRNLREKRLLRVLGEDYNAEWMSIDRPNVLEFKQNSGIAYKTDPMLRQALRDLNFTFQDPTGSTFQPQPQLVNVFKDWLIRKASCPVHFRWHDVGELYWPRWVKKGECDNGTPCSWPAGMRCIPVDSHTVYILRWHCRLSLPRRRSRVRGFRNIYSKRRLRDGDNEDHPREVRCKWLKVPYPVIAECFCSC
ncbi:noggin-2-like [Tubulanus polymorphus]|uniref:noggin-2-like n=1 Tax=Tubulanus polymorphus TaxID=672921 RepID=UPI003DA3B773